TTRARSAGRNSSPPAARARTAGSTAPQAEATSGAPPLSARSAHAIAFRHSVDATDRTSPSGRVSGGRIVRRATSAHSRACRKFSSVTDIRTSGHPAVEGVAAHDDHGGPAQQREGPRPGVRPRPGDRDAEKPVHGHRPEVEVDALDDALEVVREPRGEAG